MYKIIFISFIATILLACSKKNDVITIKKTDTLYLPPPNNSFNDIFPLIKGKWKATLYSAKIPRTGKPDSLVTIPNIDSIGVPFIDFDALDMIDFISSDLISFKKGNSSTWTNYNTNSSFYIDWYRHQILSFNGPIQNYIIIYNNSNSLQIEYRSSDNTYYRQTFFVRPK